MRDPNNPCLFCNVKDTGSNHENELAYSSYDTYPVSKLHCLIIPKRHIKDYFDLTKEELIACNSLVRIVKDEILKKDETVKGKESVKEEASKVEEKPESPSEKK